MILVDSSVWIALLRNQVTPQVATLLTVRDPMNLLVADLVLTEVLQGARSNRHAAEIERELAAFSHIAVSSPAMAPVAAHLYRQLRERGITIRTTVDLIIATYCIVHGHHLLHQDRDFDPFAEHCGLLIA